MDQMEIFRSSLQQLKNRLALVEYSTIPAQLAEADTIKREIARRLGCCV